MTSIMILNILVSLVALYFFEGTVAAQTVSNHVSQGLLNSLEELSRLVDISYCVGTTGVQRPFQCLSRCDDFPDFDLITTWNTGIFLSDSCGYVALSHASKRILIAFRGTYSITNTIIDLSAYPQPYIPYKGDPDVPGSECSNCTVHAGFMTSWLNTRTTILPHVSAAYQKYPDYEITLVGHSLGGAVAAIAGLEMRLKGWNPLVTTFGEPMIGNGEFAQYFDEQFGLGDAIGIPPINGWRFRRVTHIGDPVPLLPPREWGYRAHAGEIYISRSELPPTIGDLHICENDFDPSCSAGFLFGLYRAMNPPESASSVDCPRVESVSSKHQIVIDEHGNQGHFDCKMQDKDISTALRWDWPLIPGRYRLWQLFYAHRDYFWRIGLCVPGGDPTG